MNLLKSSSDDAGCRCDCGCESRPQALAMATVPAQVWEQPYEPAKGLYQGTIFPSLDKPFFATGNKLGGGYLG